MNNYPVDELLQKLCSVTEYDVVRLEDDVLGNARFAVRGLGKHPSLIVIGGIYPHDSVEFPEWEGRDNS